MEPTTRNGAVPATSVTQIDAQTVLVEMSELYTGCVAQFMHGDLELETFLQCRGKQPRSVVFVCSCVLELFVKFRWFEVHNLFGYPGQTIFFSISTTKSVTEEFKMRDSLTFGSDVAGGSQFRMRFSYHEIQ